MRTDEYYRDLFPYDLIEVFSEPPVLFDERPMDVERRQRREFAFGYTKRPQQQQTNPDNPRAIVITGKGPSEGLQRYQSFGQEDGKTFMQRFQTRMEEHRNTTRIDVGPVYALPPKTAQKYAAGVEFRELIFDVDIFPDYNPFRMCKCAEAQRGEPPYVCVSCWPYLCAAMHTLDFLLQKRFGFHECMWLFSGRRGVHCWVLDPDAGLLTEATRRNIATLIRSLSRLQGVRPTVWMEHQEYMANLYTDILKPRFDALMEAQQINLSNRDTLGVIANLFSLASERSDYKLLMARLDNNPPYSHIAWSTMVLIAAEMKIQLFDLVFFVLFPKIDYNVVPSPVHLLRCPMSVHTGTFGIVVPLTLSEVDELNPNALPNLQNFYSMQSFQRWYDRFDQYLWSRHPLASELVCLVCASEVLSLAKLTRAALFGYDLEAWREHMREKHPGANLTLPPQNSTLRELIHTRTARSGLTDWGRKYNLFKQLREQL